MKEILTETHYLTVSKTLPPNSHYVGRAYGESCNYYYGYSCYQDLNFLPVFEINMEEIKFSAGKLAGQICTSSTYDCAPSYSSCFVGTFGNNDTITNGFFTPGTFSTPYEAGFTAIIKNKNDNTENITDGSKIKKMKSSSKVVRIDKNFKIYASEKTNLYDDIKNYRFGDNNKDWSENSFGKPSVPNPKEERISDNIYEGNSDTLTSYNFYNANASTEYGRYIDNGIKDGSIKCNLTSPCTPEQLKKKTGKDLTPSPEIIKKIHEMESYLAMPYNDDRKPSDVSKGNCTVGYGRLIHKGPCKKVESPYTEKYEEFVAKKITEVDLQKYYEAGFQENLKIAVAEVQKLYPKKTMSQPQFDSLVDLAFNNWGLTLAIYDLPDSTDCLTTTKIINKNIKKINSELPGLIPRREMDKGLLCEDCTKYLNK